MSDPIDQILDLASALRDVIPKTYVPPSSGTKPVTEQILPHSMVEGTRGYIVRVCYQINGCYEKGWYDGCAVMMRKLLETLIIEAFEKHHLESTIKDATTNNFFYLGALISAVLKESTWTLGRNSRQGLIELKDLGDQSAHSRRFVAHREDIDKVSSDFRVVCQELLFIAGLA